MGRRHQHALFLRAYDALVRLGDSVLIYYRPSPSDPAEEVDVIVAKILMESELDDLNRAYD